VLCRNRIHDITPLSSLENLVYLDISENEISDLSPLYALPSLRYLARSGNPAKTGRMELREAIPSLAVLR